MNAIIGWIFNGTTPVWENETAVQVVLYLGSGVEATYKGYARAIAPRTAQWWKPGDLIVYNQQEIAFPECQCEGETVTHVGIICGKEQIFIGKLDAPMLVGFRSTPTFAPGELVLEFA